MAEIPLYDDEHQPPTARPRAEVRIERVAVHPYPDGRRMKLSLALTPFAERPSLDATVSNAQGQEVASLSLVEAMDTELDFTIHLRGPEPRGAHELRLVLFYRAGDEPDSDRQVVDEHRQVFDPAASGAAA